MSYRLVVDKPARKELEDIPLKKRVKILSALKEFCETNKGNIETIKPFTGEYRLRVGDYRVRFAIDYARDELIVLHVFIRGAAYK